MVRRKTTKTRVLPIPERILHTALHLYGGQGYFNTSIHDIQRASGVSMGSIYNHFSGKEAIAKALYNDLVARMENLVDRATSEHDTAHDQGRAMVEWLFDLTEKEPATIGYILNARHREFLSDEPPICSSKPFVKLRDIVLNGMKRGEVRTMDPWVAASMAFGPALRMIALRLDGMIETPLPQSLDELWNLTWASIQVEAPKAGAESN